MRPIASAVRLVLSLLVSWSGLVLPASAHVAPQPAFAPWQSTISRQIQAFRHRDAPTAFRYAAAAFQVAFASPEAFFVAIMNAGYRPLMNPRSYDFGTFRKLRDGAVLQEVNVVGSDLGRYQVFFQVTDETGGWRVQGVQLVKQPGQET